jgi:hypothetical protein
LSEELRHALHLQPSLGMSPFTRVAPEITHFTHGVKRVEVPALQVDEAATMYEIWMKNHSLHTRE